MKTKQTFIFINLLLLTILLSCQTDSLDISNKNIVDKTRTISYKNLNELQSLEKFITKHHLNLEIKLYQPNLESKSQNRIINEQFYNAKILESDVAVVTNRVNKQSYALKMHVENALPNAFFNYVIEEGLEDTLVYIKEYQPNIDWLSNQSYFDYAEYTGKINTYNIEGNLVASEIQENGIQTQSAFYDPCAPISPIGGGSTGGTIVCTKNYTYYNCNDCSCVCVSVTETCRFVANNTRTTSIISQTPCGPGGGSGGSPGAPINSPSIEQGVYNTCKVETNHNDCYVYCGSQTNCTTEDQAMYDCLVTETNCEDANPCKRLNNILSENTDFKSKLAELDNKLDANFEAKVTQLEDGTVESSDGNEDNPHINLPEPNSPYTHIAHTHPDNDNFETYSIFSFGDLRRFSELAYNNHIKHNKFVAYLTTKKGTKYALTIKNKTKLTNAFYSWNVGSVSSTEEITKFLQSQQNQLDLEYKYYGSLENPNPDALITETDTDNENILKQFMNFLNEADMGIDIFEADDNFENFKKIELENSTITKTDC